MIDKADVRVLAFITVADDPAAAGQVIHKNSHIIVGIRSGPGSESEALKAAEASGKIVMAERLPVRSGDIISGMYDPDKQQTSELAAAQKKGILLDSGGLWFRMAMPAIKQGLLPDTISTGMDSKSIMLPRATMTNVMSKFLAMGLTLGRRSNRLRINPAKADQTGSGAVIWDRWNQVELRIWRCFRSAMVASVTWIPGT